MGIKYINPYYWVDDHPLLYGNNGSLDPGTHAISHPNQFPPTSISTGAFESTGRAVGRALPPCRASPQVGVG